MPEPTLQAKRPDQPVRVHRQDATAKTDLPGEPPLQASDRNLKPLAGNSPLLARPHNLTQAGVCAGLGEYFGIDPTIVRLLFMLAFFTGFGGIAIVYLIMALIVPEQTTADAQ